MSPLDHAREKFGEFDLLASIYSMQIIWANKKVHDILGYAPNELTNMSMRKIVVLDSSILTNIMSKVLAKKQKEDTQMISKKNGEKIRMKANFSTFMFKSEPFVVLRVQKV